MVRKSATRAETLIAAAKRVATPVNVSLRSVWGSNTCDRPSEVTVSKGLKEAEENKGSDLVSREGVSGDIDLLRNEPEA
jgi:hypothetical protein